MSRPSMETQRSEAEDDAKRGGEHTHDDQAMGDGRSSKGSNIAPEGGDPLQAHAADFGADMVTNIVEVGFIGELLKLPSTSPEADRLLSNVSVVKVSHLEGFVAFVILADIVVTALEVDGTVRLTRLYQWWAMISCTIFTAELIARLAAARNSGSKRGKFGSGRANSGGRSSASFDDEAAATAAPSAEPSARQSARQSDTMMSELSGAAAGGMRLSRQSPQRDSQSTLSSKRRQQRRAPKRDFLLLFDAVLVTAGFVDMLRRNHLLHLTSGGSTLMTLSLLRCFRIFRIVRLAAFFLRWMKGLVLLAAATPKSVKPIINVIILSTFIVTALTVWLMMAVPHAISGHEEFDQLVMEAFESVPLAALTLVGSMTGGTDWGVKVAYILWEDPAAEKIWARMMLLVTLLGFSFLLFLSLNGLITGIFLDQLIQAAQEEEDLRAMEARAETEELLEPLAEVFANDNYYGDNPVSWDEVERIVEENGEIWDRLQVDLGTAKNLFSDLDTGTLTLGTDEFLFGIFKLRGLSDSMDMLSIDYQQQRASHRLADIRSQIRTKVAKLHGKCFNFARTIKELENQVDVVEAGISEVRRLEDVLAEQRQGLATDALDSAEAKQAAPTPEQLRQEEAMLKELQQLEEQLRQLEAEEGDAAGVPADAMAAVARGIAQSVREALEDDLTQEMLAASKEEFAKRQRLSTFASYDLEPERLRAESAMTYGMPDL